MKARSVLLISSLVLATMVGSVGEAYADPAGPDALPINVISIRTDDADDQAEALTQALKSEVRKLRGWSLGEGDHSLEVLSLALKCPSPPDAACEVRIADQIKAERFIWGTLKRAPGHRVNGTIHLWARGQGQTKTEISFSDNLTEPNDESLRKVVQDALATLTGGPPKGSVKITAGAVNGQVFVDGEPSGAIKDGQATIFVSVGTHKIEIRAPGYSNTSGEVTARPNSSVGLDMKPQTEEEARKSKPNLRRIGAYSAIGVGGAFLAAGLYSSLKVNSVNGDDSYDMYRKNVTGDVCDAAKAGTPAKAGTVGAATPGEVEDMCSTANKFGTLQYVFYGLGVLSAGAGVYLLVTDKPKTEQQSPPAAARLRIVPSVGPRVSGLDLQYTF